MVNITRKWNGSRVLVLTRTNLADDVYIQVRLGMFAQQPGHDRTNNNDLGFIKNNTVKHFGSFGAAADFDSYLELVS
jgi:hypothetical protein